MDNVTVSFQYERAHITLNYPLAITDMPQTSLKKLFKLMVSDYRREANEEAVRTTHEALKAYVVETKKRGTMLLLISKRDLWIRNTTTVQTCVLPQQTTNGY